MALELPDYAVIALNLIGLPWPGIDEDELRRWATDVRHFADDICDNSSQVNQAMRDLADSSESSTISAVADEWERHHRLLTDLHGPINDFAGALDMAADAVVAQKGVVIGAAVALAAEFTATQIGAIFSLGADEAAVPAEVISTRTIVKFALEELAGVIIGKLVNVAAQEITDHLNRTISSMLSGGLQAGMEVQSLKLSPAAVTNVARKLNGQATKVEETGSKAHAQNTSRSIEDNTGGGGWSEVINALKQMLLDIAGGLFKNLPATISKVLGEIAEFLLRFVERVKTADEEGSPAVTADDAKPALPETGDGPTPADPEAAQRALGEEMAADRNAEINRQINETLGKVNPKFDPRESAYSENCTGVVQANELTRRGVPSEAGPLEKPLRSDEGGTGGRPLSVIEEPWGVKFRPGSKAEIEQAFKEPGSRGVVYIRWNRRGAHVFNVENVGGEVRFVDGQPHPPVTDASSYFDKGGNTMYVRLDDRPTPPADAIKPYLEPGKGS